jgi:hypothetical protein
MYQNHFSGVYISGQKRYLSPPPPPLATHRFFYSYWVLIALILPYFEFILPCNFPFLFFPFTFFFFPLSPFFFYIFPPFLFTFSYFPPKLHQLISPLLPRGGGVFQIRYTVDPCHFLNYCCLLGLGCRVLILIAI